MSEADDSVGRPSPLRRADEAQAKTKAKAKAKLKAMANLN